MEQRLLLATTISFVILLCWSTFTTKPASLKNQINKSQLYENKEDIKLSSANLMPVAASLPDKEIKKVVETDKFILNFSNIGGVLSDVIIKDKGKQISLPVKNYGNLNGYENGVFELLSENNKNQIEYVYENNEVRIAKNYTFEEGNFLINQSFLIEYKNKFILDKIKFKSFSLDMSKMRENHHHVDRNDFLNEYSVAFADKIIRKNNASKFSVKDQKNESKQIDWLGFRERYYCAIFKPLFSISEYFISPVNESNLDLGVSLDKESLAGESQIYTINSIYYVGPQDPMILKKYNDQIGKMDQIVNFNVGSFSDIFALGLGDFFAKMLLFLLIMIHKIVFNWGVAVILVAIIICLVTQPLTLRSMAFMKKMQKLKPELDKIKEKNKNNKQKQQQEMVGFYKKHNINPMAGCLPMFFQMPIFFAIFQLLWRYVGLKGEGFLWIKDLSESDKLFVLPHIIPIINVAEINILPLIVFVLAMIQQKFSNKNVVAMDEMQATQMKIMKFVFPAMMLVFFYNFSSAIALYFTVFYSFSAYTQWQASKL